MLFYTALQLPCSLASQACFWGQVAGACWLGFSLLLTLSTQRLWQALWVGQMWEPLSFISWPCAATYATVPWGQAVPMDGAGCGFWVPWGVLHVACCGRNKAWRCWLWLPSMMCLSSTSWSCNRFLLSSRRYSKQPLFCMLETGSVFYRCIRFVNGYVCWWIICIKVHI